MDTRPGRVALAIAAAIVVYQVFVPPAVGISDNGDGAKILGRYNLARPGNAPDRDTFRFLRLRYTYEPSHRWVSGFTTSETLLLWTAMGLNWLVSKDGAFDIRVMGAVHAALFLAAFALLIPLVAGATRRRAAPLLALAVAVFCDVMYVSQFNTFYMDAGAFGFLLLEAVFLARALCLPPPRTADAWAAVLFSILLVTVKSQHALLGFLLAPFFLWKRKSLWPRRPRLWGGVAAGAVTLSSTAMLLWGAPRGYTTPALFNVIFFRVLPAAQNPKAELSTLGLDDSYLAYSGMYSYEPRSPMHGGAFKKEFARRASYGRLLKLYATHPVRPLRLLRIGLTEAVQQRPATGTFDRSAGYPEFFRSRAFSAWSRAKAAVFRHKDWGYLIVFLLAAAAVAWRAPAAGALLAAAGLVELGVASLADGCETLRHLFLFNTIWDLTFVAAVCAVAFSAPAGPRLFRAWKARRGLKSETALIAGHR